MLSKLDRVLDIKHLSQLKLRLSFDLRFASILLLVMDKEIIKIDNNFLVQNKY